MVFVNPFRLAKEIEKYEASPPQIRFPGRFLTRCILSYSLIVFAGFFFIYHLFTLISVVLLSLAVFYGIRLYQLWRTLGLSRPKYFGFTLLLWLLLAAAATAARIAVIFLLSPIL